MRHGHWKGCLVAGAMACLGLGPAHASTSQSTIIGVFGGVTVNGNVLHIPDASSTTYYDNTGRAVYGIVNSTNPATTGSPPIQSTGSTLTWGDDNGGAGASSILNFFGAVIPSSIDQPFRVGRLTYSNGTSSLTSLIFGATISFYDGSISAANFLGTDTIVINTTSNLGQSTAQDADYLNICGNQSNICGSSIEAIESSQGGTGLTVDLFGVIVGDPQLFLTSAMVTPGQSPTMNGFIGNDLPAALPEPSTVTLVGASMLAMGGSLRRRRRS